MNHECCDGNPIRFLLSAPVRLTVLLLLGKFVYGVLIDFWLTVKAVTLIYISCMVRLFHLLYKGNKVLFIIW